MSKKYKKVCATLNYIEHFLILACAFCLKLFAWYFYSNYEFCNRIKQEKEKGTW